MNGISQLWGLIDKGRRGENIGRSTGIPKLDKVIGGIQPSRYYTILQVQVREKVVYYNLSCITY